jgi:hypothetical protein
MRRYSGTAMLHIPTGRYLAQEGVGPLAVWIDKHPQYYARDLFDGFWVES